MRSNTDRKQEAIGGTRLWVVFFTASAVLLLYLRAQFVEIGWGRLLLLIAAIIDFGVIIPLVIQLRNRLQEIDGGEEDAAAEY